MLWRASAYGLVSSLSRQDPSWPTHRHLWPRRSYRAVTLLHPFNFTSPITPVPIISHTGTDFCHLLPPALKTPMASSQLLYATPTLPKVVYCLPRNCRAAPDWLTQQASLLSGDWSTSSRRSEPFESIHPWLLSFCPRTLCSVSLHVILTYLSQLIILDIILNINNSLCYIKLPI